MKRKTAKVVVDRVIRFHIIANVHSGGQCVIGHGGVSYAVFDNWRNGVEYLREVADALERVGLKKEGRQA